MGDNAQFQGIIKPWEGVINMDKIDRMRAFALVAQNASFTLAAQRLGRSSRLVSKYVADLEEALGVQLLNRTTRSVSLTDAGATYLAMCEPLLDGFDEMEEAGAQCANVSARCDTDFCADRVRLTTVGPVAGGFCRKAH